VREPCERLFGAVRSGIVHSHVWARLYLGKAVSDRSTLEDLSQSTESEPKRGRKLLILKGEMSEWLKEHACVDVPP